MGAQSGCRALAWALVVLPLVQKAETQSGTEQSWASQEATVNAQRVTFIPPITGFPTMSSPNAAHGGRVCSTWGDFHYKTFDGDVFRFPGLCNYVFSAHCGAAYEDFNLQLRRGLVGSRPTVTHIILKTQGLVLEVSSGSILVNGRREELPYSRAGLLVEESSAYVKVNIRLMLTFTWNGEDSALLELDPRYANQTCGLCGDFNGLPAINEFYAHNARLTPLQFGNLQKLDGPTEQCQDPLPAPADNCTDGEGICRQTLLGPAFAQCHRLVDAEVYVATCTQDLCRCPTCPCATFAEYSRQCAHAGGQPQSWRGPDLCPQTCPLNMQHQECGSPCADTCSNPERSQLCEDHCVDGCFCPLGTVLDDVTHSGCLPLRQCPCTHGGRPYAPGASFTTSCSSCTCSGGLWQCQDLPCPGICSVQGGSHISTYDEKLYDVHGDCSYVLTKVSPTCWALPGPSALLHPRKGSMMAIRAVKSPGVPFREEAHTHGGQGAPRGFLGTGHHAHTAPPCPGWALADPGHGWALSRQICAGNALTVLAELRRCGLTDNENCLRAVMLSLSGGDTAIQIQANGGVFVNSISTQLPVSVGTWPPGNGRCGGQAGPLGGGTEPAESLASSLWPCKSRKGPGLGSHLQGGAARGLICDSVGTRVAHTRCPASRERQREFPPSSRALEGRLGFLPGSPRSPQLRLGWSARRPLTVPPQPAANITVFRPSSFFILVQTGLGLQLQVQLVPLMQVFLRLDPSYQGQMCGLCGNFNRNQADDFRTISGVVEGTAAAFANTWKTQAACPNVKNGFEDPCSLSVENENYAQHWCSLLTDPAGAFSSCHSVISPGPFHSNCMFDTCSCEKSEDCMCAALSSYVRACAARGVLLGGWRDGVCNKYVSSCPKTQSYAYVVDSCQPTCRSLSQADVTCNVAFVPVDGCTCPSGTFLDDTGDCVPAEACPCYSRGSVLAPGEVLHDNGVVCSCASGKLSCLGAVEESTGCVAPMLFLDCSNASADTPGAECVRSCHVLDVDCFSTRCVSGCVCPAGLLADGSGGCVAEEDCPCLHNEAAYKPGETIRVDCNTCTCRGRRWECSRRPCLGTCVAYGDGHFITFDGERYSFEGSCEYTLAQDYCAGNNASNGSFRIVTENVPCGTTGVTCSKAIKIFLENYELILHEGSYKVVQRGPGGDLPYKIRYMGIYLAVETRSGMVVSWDRKTSVFIRLHQEYKGRVCGLCGNFDNNALNDFTTRSQSVVGDALEFGNSWKFSPSCPDAQAPKDPCAANPYRKPWAQKQCSIVNSATFRACRSQVDSTRYYEACVSDACACDSGGDRECFCTAVAAYAQACHEAGVCVSWRTPDVCPLFCDYYNPQGECEWHYQPCGAPCLRTCRNPSGHCLMDLPGLEGCYPKCPPSKPFFNEDEMKCVAQCGGCYDEDGNYHDAGTRVPTAENCQSCDCTSGGLQCTYSPAACTCTYEGRTYAYGDVIYNTTDGLGACLIAICRDNGTIVRKAEECPGTPSPTPFTFTSTAAPPSTTGAVPTPSTVCVQEHCRWSDWYDSGRPELGMGGGDFETFENLRQRGYRFCPAPAHVECRAQQFPDMPLEKLGQKVECGQARGLTCLNSEQNPPLCHNYELRVLCCDYVPCSTSPAPGTSQRPSSQPLPTSTQTTPTRGTTLLSMVPSASQTPSAKPASTVTRVGSSSVVPATTTCEPRCQWTEWFDEDYPKSEEAGGDVESYDKIRRAGGAVCEQPQGIECQAENFPDVRLEELNQRVHCDVSFGLVCRNDEQVGLFKMCYNYKIRVLCCGYGHCGEPTSPTATATSSTVTATTVATSTATTATTSTATAPTATASTATVTTVATATVTTATTSTATAPTATASTATATTVATSTAPTATTSTATAPTATASTATVTTVATSTAPTATTSTATAPTATASTATATTVATSTAPTAATSTAPTATASTATAPTATASTATATTVATSTAPTATTSTATAPMATTSTATTVATSTATTAATSTATAPTPIAPMSPTATATATTATTSTATVTTAATSTAAIATVATSAATAPTSPTASSTTTAVSPATQPRTRPGSTGVTRSPASSATPAPSLSTGLTAQVTSSRPSHTGTLPVSATSVLPTHTASRGPTPASVMTQTSTSQPLTGTAVGKTGTTSTGPLSTSHPETSMPGTPVSTGTTTCEPHCQWTEWFDEDYPKSEKAGGDVESYDKIRRAGGAVCEQPQGIECQAENFPDVRLEELNQRVHCDVSFGLVCRNDEQVGLFKMCYNYKIRVLCCGYGHCGEPTSPTATATSSTVTATTVATSTATTATTSTATAPTATASTATVTTVATSTATTATASTATGPTATTSTATVTTVATSTAPTATTSTATAPTATASTATAPTATASTATAPTAATSTATAPTAATSTATAPTPMASTSPTTTATAPTATTSTARVTTAATSTAAIATAATSAATAPTSPTASSTTTTVPPATQPTTWPGSTGVTRSPTSSATPASSLSTGLTARVTLSPSHTGTLPVSATGSLTSPPGSTEPTIPWRATSVLPTHTASRGPTPTSVTMETSTSQLLMGTAVGTTGTTSTGPLSTSHPETSMPGIPVSTATTGATTSQGTTSCQPKCQWTEWFDVDFPTSGVRGGDMETYDNIRAAGGKMCQQPQKIECRAESYPEVSIDQIGQVLSCSLEVGLVCRNEDQRGQFTMCFNYNIRVYCCDDVRHCPTTATPYLTSTTLPATSSSTATVPWPSTSATTQTQPTSTAPPATGRSTATVPSPSISAVTQTGAPTTAPPTAHIHETTFGTTLLPTPVTPNTRATTYTRSLHPTASPQVTELPTRPFETTPGPPITTPSTGHATSSTGAGTRASVSTRMPEPSTSSLGTTLGSSMATSTATVSSQKTHTSSTPLVTTSPETRSTACQPRCAWTDWLDQSYPMPGASGGDFETYANIQAAGGAICQQPLQLQCRAEALPEEALQDLGQVVQCRLEEGLVCRNRDQSSLMCLNYQIRVFCCDHSHCPSPAGSTSTTPAPSPSTISTSTGSLSSKVTTQTHLSSPGTIKRVSTPTTLTGPSSTGTTQSISSTPTRVTGPFSTGTTQSISSTTRMTGPSSTGTTKKVYTSTSVTGPFSTGTTQRVSTPTRMTGPSSTGTSQRVSTTTPLTGPSSTGTTKRVSIPTRVTGPSSTGTTQRVSTTTPLTGPSSTGTTKGVSTTTHVTGSSSTGTTQRVSSATTLTGPSSMGTTKGVSTTTHVTGPSSTGTTQRVSSATTLTGPSSTGTTQRVSTPTHMTGPFSTGTTKRVYASTSVTGPSSTGTTKRVSTPTRVTGPSYPGTTQRVSSPTILTGPSSTGTSQRVSTPTPLTGPSSTGTTQRVSTPTRVTGPSSTGTTQRVSTTTPLTGPSSMGTTKGVSTTTHVTGPSSTGTTQRVSTTTPLTGPSSMGTTKGVSTTTHVTGPSSTGTTKGVSTTTHVTGPSSTGTTQRVSSATTLTGPSSMGTTKGVSTTTHVTGPSSTGTTKGVSTTTHVTGPSSTGTTQRVSSATTLTGPSSMGTTKGVSTPTRVTGPSSTGTTQRVSTTTPLTGPSSTGTTKGVSTTTHVTGPSSTGTTQRVSFATTLTGPSYPGTTQRVSSPTILTGPSSTGTSQRVSTPTRVTGPSSTGTTQRVSTTTPLTGPSSMGTTKGVSTTTHVTGPSSTGTTKRVYASTSVTGPSSTGTTKRVSTPTRVTGPSYPGTTQRVSSPTILTGPSSTGTSQRVSTPTPLTGPSPTGTTQRVSTTTPLTGPSSTGTTKGVSTTTRVTGPSSTGTTQRVSSATTLTGPSSMGTTKGVSTPTRVTGPSSTGTTQRVSSATTLTGPSSMGTTKGVSTPTHMTGPFSTGTTKRVYASTSVTGPSSTGTTKRVSTPTRVTGPSYPGTTQRVSSPTPLTGPSPTGTTQRVSTPTRVTGPSSTGTTQRVSTTTPLTGPSPTGTTKGVSTTTHVTGPSSPGTTQRVSSATTLTGPSSMGTTKGVSTTTHVTGPSSMGTTKGVSTTAHVTGPSSTGTTSSTGAGTRASVSTRMPEPSTSSLGTTLGSSMATSTATVSSQKTHTSSTPLVTTSPDIGSTACQPRCAWTDWLDQSYPMPGASGGDFETYANIQAAGGAICQQPLQLQCRAEALPEEALQDLGQVVQCRLEEGLVCRNRDQSSLMCLNYQIRVFCCDHSHCPSPAGPTSTTPAPSPSTISTSTGSLSSKITTQTHLSSPGTIKRVSTPTTLTGPSSTGTTQSISSTPTRVTGPFSTGTTQSISSTTRMTGPSSTGTTKKVYTSTSVTGPFSTGTTKRVYATTSVTGPSSTGTRQSVYTSTRVTGPFSTGTTQRVSSPTTLTGPSSMGTTQRVSIPTRMTGPSSTGTSQRVSTTTPLTGPSSTGTTKRVSTPTRVTGPSSTGTTQRVSTTTPLTGPSSTGTTKGVSTTTHVTGPSSTGTTQRVSSATTLTGPSSTGTTQRVSTPTHMTGPFSTGTTKRVYASTSVTGPSSTGTTKRVSTPTRVTGPSSTGTTQRVSTTTPLTGPSSMGTTKGVSTTTHVTGPSSTGTTQRVSTTTPLTGPSSTGTTQSISSTPTRMTGPSSTGTTKKVYTSTSVTGPFSTGTTKRVYASTRVTGPSSMGTTGRVYTSSTVTGPSYSGTTQRVYTSTSVTGPSSKGTTQRVSTPTRVTGPSSTRTTGKVYTSTTLTGPSSTGTTQRVSTSTTVTGPFSPGTTESISTPSPSAFPGSPPMTTKPGLPSVSPTGPLLTSPISTASWSPPTTSSWSGVASGSPGTFSISTASPSPTTACLCHAFGKFFLPGDIIYNKTDGVGCHFLAICNQRCDIDRFQGACSTPSPSGTSVSVPPDTPVPGCDRTIPPRQVNESWTLEDCTVARCEGDNRVVLLGPKPMGDVVCVNGHLPVRVQSGDGPCDYSYECECSCSGWGDTHYETFDGTSYSFLDNCTHVLMREIRPRHGNLSILLYNHYCEAAASCPRALGVHYESMDIVLTTTPGADGQEESLILFSQMRVRQSFSKNGLTVTAMGATEMSIEIPAVGVRVIFNGRVFQAQLSYSHFSYNTEGQCGTCTNSRRDDCRRPDGTTAPTCQDMARSWLVPNSSGEGCWAPTGLPPTASPLSSAPSTPTSTPCPPEPLCELLLSPVFTGCHGLVPPGPFFSTCVSDSCGPSRPEALCQSLEAYSALCRTRGVCPDWRNATSGLCDLTCPPTKVYKPCGPAQPKSCDSRSQSPASRGLAEGCFCPDGHILFNSHTDVCVPECPCVGPDGFPKFPGERWVSNCQSCVCDEGSVSVQCVPVQCEARDQPQECGWAGFVAQTRPLADNPCCMETLCVCNTSTCPQSPPKCRPGEELACTQAENSCCPTFSCRPQLCTYNGTVYGVGATFPAVIPCHTCTCLSVDTHDPTVQCEEEACNATCPQGFQYSRVAGQCCGECVQTACLTSDGRLVQPNETWVNSLVDNCTLYHCQAENGPPMLTPTPVACPDVSSCRGILRKIGCCYSCEEVDSCQVRASMTVLRHRGCATQTAVSVPFCEGFCPGASRYSTGARATQCPCVCCQEARAHQEVVTVQCPNGTAFQHTYTHVDECSCGPSCVSSAQAPEDSTPTFPIYGFTAV
ncbi:mucin-5B [Megaptera novaeangliae]